MPLVKLPLLGNVNKNVDPIALATNCVEIIDGYIDEAGFFNNRAGLVEIADLGTGLLMDGAFWWDELQIHIFVSGTNIYRVETSGSFVLLGTGMQPGARVTFATARIAGADVLAMANGGTIFTTNGTTLTEITDVDAPTKSTHIVFMDKYLISNDLATGEEGKVKYSDVNDPLVWNALSFFETERKPDGVTAIGTVGNQLVVFGPRSIEFFYNDGVTPFRRFDGGESNIGTSAPHSVQYAENMFWLFLDENRRLNKMSGRESTYVSGPYDRELNAINNIDKMTSMIVNIDGRSFYVMNFANDDKTFVYDYILDRWYRWGEWDSSVSRYRRFKGLGSSFNVKNGEQWVGDKANGKIYRMGPDIYQDDGAVVRRSILTGYFDHNTAQRKISKKLMFRIKRGVAKDISDTAGRVEIRYRDNDEGAFGTSRFVSTGSAGDSRFHYELRRNGQYRQRQWEFVSSDSMPFIIGSFEEDVTLGVS